MYTPYHQAIKKQMEKFAKDKKVMFIGQQTASEDFYGTLKDVPMKKRTEMPVAEELQMGISIGLAMEGFIPISIYQRMDFLPRACDQLVNHLDLIEEMSRGMFDPKIIIRTTIGTNNPFNVGLQHNKDLTRGFNMLLDNILLYNIKTVDEVNNIYDMARRGNRSMIIVEEQKLYYE